MAHRRLTFAKEVLAVHDAINEVLIIEDKAGESIIADEAHRFEGLDPVFADKNAMLAPMLILGAASRLTSGMEPAKLVGITYANQGVLFTPIDDNTVLMLTTRIESLSEVTEEVHRALPELLKRRSMGSEKYAVESAVDADKIIRSFLATTKRGDPTRAQIQSVTLDERDHVWRASGSFRSRFSLRSLHYEVAIDARTGSVTEFATHPQLDLLFVASAIVVAVAGVLLYYYYYILTAGPR